MGYATREEAMKAAEECWHLMKQPKNWKIDVWDNLGWCWHLTCGCITVSKSCKDGVYYALMSDEIDRPGSGLSAWTMNGVYFNDPNTAVYHAIQNAKRHVARLQEVINSVAHLLVEE